MIQERRKLNLRDYLYILVAIGGLAWMGKVFVLANTVEENKKYRESAQASLNNHETRISVVEGNIKDIKELLQELNKKMDRSERWGRRDAH